jgi:glutamate N-acetyltransferase/amino-acid N-acetyltransferase
MKNNFKEIPGSIVAPQGFRASGVFCDIKKLGTGKGSNKGQKRDLALIVSETPATIAGMFTTNQVCAAPVKVCVERMKNGTAQVVVVNSGNANACTGKQGLADAREMVLFTERALNLPKGSALVGSTGRIGVPMPMDNVRAGIIEAATLLGSTTEHADNAVEAIMTSDTKPKQIAVEFKLGGKTVRIGGMCKGAGMIQPGMSATGARPAALPSPERSLGWHLSQLKGLNIPPRTPMALHATMLCFVTTDAAIEQEALQAALKEAVANGFNRITVDGDMSTNDTVLVLANGLAENRKITRREIHDAIFLAEQSPAKKKKLRDAVTFLAALKFVCLELAKKIVRDGEGVHRVVTVRVNGAKTIQDADAAARAVANSALVKTSWHGGDPNWGRIIDAIGYSPTTVVEEKIDIGYSAVGGKKILWSLKSGQPTKATFKELCAAVAPKEFELHINLNLGKAGAVMYAADLTEEYVDFNKGDVTDASSLGG